MTISELLDRLNQMVLPGDLPVFQIILGVFILYLLLAMMWYSLQQSMWSSKIVSTESIAEVSKQLAEAEAKAKEKSADSREIWDVSYYQQKRFIEINIKQNEDIFRLTIRMIILGLCLIFAGLAYDFIFGLFLIFFKSTYNFVTPPVANMNISWAAVIAGLITQFIAATILVVFRSIFSQTMEYFKATERIASMGVALSVIEKLPPGSKDMKAQTLIALATMYIGEQRDSTNPAEPQVARENNDKQT